MIRSGTIALGCAAIAIMTLTLKMPTGTAASAAAPDGKGHLRGEVRRLPPG